MDKPTQIARILLENGMVGFSEEPIRFKSGILSPVYIDNRKFIFMPKEWHAVIEGFERIIEHNGIEFDVIAGMEAAGIPHSSVLAFVLNKPSVFIRKEIKDHGTKKRIEGGDVSGKRVLLIEDLVSMGTSSLSGIKAIREEGGRVSDCVIIISYGFSEAGAAFEKENVKLYSLTSFPVVVREAEKMNLFSPDKIAVINQWFRDPRAWAVSAEKETDS